MESLTAPSSPAPAAPSQPSTSPTAQDKLLEAEANKVIELAAARTRSQPPKGPMPIRRSLQTILAGIKAATKQQIDLHNQKMEEYQRASRVSECRRLSNIPERYRNASLSDIDKVPADCIEQYQAAVKRLRVAQEQPGIFAMIGEIGDGKTHLACGLVNAFCIAGRSAKRIKCADYIEGYRSQWKSNQPGAESAFESTHVRFALLVLDEWQVRGETASENTLLLRLIDKRYEACKTTLIIGNYATQGEFEKSIDGRIADRLCDGGGMIICDWPSLRGRLNQAILKNNRG